MQKQNMEMALFFKKKKRDGTLVVPFLSKIKISQTRHLVDSKSYLNSQGQVITNV